MTIRNAQSILKQKLTGIYEAREAEHIMHMVMEKITGLSRIERLLAKEEPLSVDQDILLQKYTAELLRKRPVQYVLEEAHFMGITFFVNENALIPRPETEELVEWICAEIKKKNAGPATLLDIGTGSGCIPVTIKKKFKNSHIAAVDISEPALEVARRNAEHQKVAIRFLQCDILDEKSRDTLSAYDIIVSNPPYIGMSEKTDMSENVLFYEPHTALFVTGEDTLVFYKEIAIFARSHLNDEGLLFFEINERFGREVVDLLKSLDFENIELRKDMQGKDRMVKCLFKK